MSVLDRIHRPGDALLAHVAPGGVLEPLPKAKGRVPQHRCTRCGCYATPGNSILRGGLYWCRVCCGGAVAVPGEWPEEAQ